MWVNRRNSRLWVIHSFSVVQGIAQIQALSGRALTARPFLTWRCPRRLFTKLSTQSILSVDLQSAAAWPIRWQLAHVSFGLEH